MTSPATSGPAFVFTCEHGGNHIPARYRNYFAAKRAMLESHQGFDVGALKLAQDFARAFEAPLIAATTSRLLVDLNRSRRHRDLHSKILGDAPSALRQEIVEHYYLPYRKSVNQEIENLLQRTRPVVHISVHSFTPKLNGVVRNADIGLLYDPARGAEKQLVTYWHQALRQALPDMTIRRNYPYAGKSDGFTTALRRQYSDDVYCGIEVEINQKHVMRDATAWRAFRKKLVAVSLTALK